MDDFNSGLLIHTEEPSTAGAPGSDDRSYQTSEAGDGPGSGSEKKRRSLRGLLKGGANMQDKLLEKLLQQVIPAEFDAPGGSGPGADVPDDGYLESRPGFNITTMSYNFRRFNARIGVVFKFQGRASRLMSWRRPTHTLSFLAVYTLICLDPHLLAVLPPAILLVAVLIPGFVARHPEPPSGSSAPGTAVGPGTAMTAGSGPGGSGGSGGANPDESAHTRSYYSHAHHAAYSPRGPPVAPARTVKPVKELSRDFFKNMRDLQNCMDDFVVVHDAVVDNVVPATNFSDEARSSALFVACFFAAGAMSVAAHLLPWRLLLLVSGWAATASGHPTLARRAAALYESLGGLVVASSPMVGGGGGSGSDEAPPHAQAAALLDRWVEADIILDQAPETREVEIFELQRRSAAEADEWEPWTFSPTPYDPMSPARLAGSSPPGGTRYFEDVLAPGGWEWSEKKWALDLWSREWVEERIITGVEVETEGERWVYDMYNEHEGLTGVIEQPQPQPAKGTTAGGGGSASQNSSNNVSWEEGFEGVGRRGEWRRRRWVRLVKRTKVVAAA
ncbi:hypothetical protein RB601_009220 [Gaeumannomyces tritici]